MPKVLTSDAVERINTYTPSPRTLSFKLVAYEIAGGKFAVWEKNLRLKPNFAGYRSEEDTRNLLAGFGAGQIELKHSSSLLFGGDVISVRPTWASWLGWHERVVPAQK